MIVARLPASGGLPRRPANQRAIARRRFIVGAAKFLLPIASLALLALLAIWPELNRSTEQGRLSYRRLTVVPETGELAEPRYRGIDASNRPYTVTADRARQSGQNRTDLAAPKADMTLESGNWVQLHAKSGVYLPKDGQLDLAGDVTLYRDDGITVTADTATVDLRQGVATSAARVHVEGPFGTLDAQGFTIVDSGAIVHFTGPGRLHLNSNSQ